MRTRSIVVMLLIAVVSGCANEEQVTSPNLGMTGAALSRENLEAEVAALWLSGSLLAPDDPYDLLEFGFTSTREQFADSIPELNSIRFVPPWIPGEIVIELTPEAAAQMREGEYTDLDSLNSLYGLTEIDTSLFFHRLWWVKLTFEENYHPERLSEIYEPVPSVLAAGPNSTAWPYFNAYPWLIGGGTSYLFREGWEDCESGCVYNRFWYFWVIGTNVELVGTWDTSEEPVPPDWWTYGQTAMCYYDSGSLPVISGISE